MELSSFSIREYTNSMRSASKDKCWPFDPSEEEEEEEEEGDDKPLPPMEARKFRWWAHELDLDLDRKAVLVVKQRSPKKRSITELFATAPQITRSEGLSEDRTEEMRKTITDDAEKMRKKKKSKGKKRKLGSEVDEQDESAIEERKKRKKKKSKRKKKQQQLEIHRHHQIHLQSKFNAGELEESQMETCSKRNHEGKSSNHSTDSKSLRELEPDEASIPLISILKKCKLRNKLSHAKKGKGVTFSGVDAVLGANEDNIVNPPSVPQISENNGDRDTGRSGYDLIDLNEALPEPIDLNCCSQDYATEILCHSSVETWSLPFNSPHKNMNSDLSAYATSSDICTELEPRMRMMVPQTQTVRLMGKDVAVVAGNNNIKSVNTGGSKAQETASSSHASCSYYSDGANNNNQNTGKLDNRSCPAEMMSFGSGQLHNSPPGNYITGNYITANPGPVISFPVVPGFNIYHHHQYPVLSPPMISFPLGSSVFPQPYGLNFAGFRDGGNNNRDKSGRR